MATKVLPSDRILYSSFFVITLAIDSYKFHRAKLITPEIVQPAVRIDFPFKPEVKHKFNRCQHFISRRIFKPPQAVGDVKRPRILPNSVTNIRGFKIVDTDFENRTSAEERETYIYDWR
ncbi:hypothetical protein LOTGIDRAFT_162379 [Lottia gigantea]|uniref:Uncharacterized protein n=1 Tax=Lottia gigantea TaxID=225164 RepID=V4ACU0_LOTGI|nr:hypothetical protein LOTGIDRAFT_162379 [Lottia gigantea]ESO92900.1 hypothetical protein LOTGIDRAFT_162379 [Lottia gigantea]